MKTYYMLFSFKTPTVLTPRFMEYNIIKRTPAYKLLGVTFDETLTFTSHITELCLKLSRTISLLIQVRSYAWICTVHRTGSIPRSRFRFQWTRKLGTTAPSVQSHGHLKWDFRWPCQSPSLWDEGGGLEELGAGLPNLRVHWNREERNLCGELYQKFLCCFL